MGDTVYWYTSPTGGVSVGKGDTLITPAIDSSKTYYAGAGNPTGCTSASRTAVAVSVVSPPSAATVTPSSDTICAGGSVQLVASSKTTGVQFYWFNSATSTDTLYTGATYTTPVIDSSATYYVAASAGSCSSATRSTASILVNPRPAAPTITVNPSSASINSGSTVSMTAASTTPNTLFNWYTVATGGSPVYTGASYTTPALTSTVTYYVESEGNNGAGCPSATRTAVTITVVPAINVSCGIANSQTNSVNGICVGCTITNPSASVDMDTTTYSTINIVAGLLGGNASQTLIFPEVSQPGDSVYIELGTGSTLLSAGVLSAIQVSSANGATANNDAQTLQSSAVKVNLLAGGTKALISFAPTAAYDRITVTVNSGIVAALTAVNIYYASDMVSQPVVTSPNPSICAGTTATLSATSSVNAKVEWFSASTGGTPIAYGDTLVTPALTATTTYYAEALRKTDSCPNTNRVPVTVNVIAAPAVPLVVNNPDTICSGGLAILQAQSVTGITVNWYSASTGGTLLYTGNVYTTAALTANTNYFASASNGTCSSASRDSVSVVVGQSPAVPVVSPADTGICAGIPVTLHVTNPQSGVTYNWYTVLSGGTAVYTGTSFTSPTLTSSVTYYVEAVNTASNCAAPSARTAVTITVTPVPSAPTVAASTIAVCGGQPATAAVSNPISGTTYQWFDAASGGNILYTGPAYTLSSVTSNITLYVQAVSASGCSSSARSSVAITADSTPAAPGVAATNVAICPGGMAIFSIATPVSGVTYNWYSTPTGGTPLATGTTYTTPALSVSATYYVEADYASGCASASRTTVNANVTSAPAAPIVSLSPVTICAGGMASLSVSNPQGGLVYDWYDAATGGTELAQGTSFTTPALSAGTTYYVAAVNGLLSCASSARSADSVAIGSQPTTPVLVSSAVVVCSGGTATLEVNNPQAGINYNWYSSATSTTPVYIGNNYSIPDDTASATYYVQASTSGGCTSPAEASGTVSVNAAPGNPTVSVADLTVCTNTPATFAINNPVSGYTYSWYASPAGSAGGTALATGATFTTPSLSANETYYVGVSTGTSCTSPGLTTVEAIVTNNLSAPSLVSGDTGTCSGVSTELEVSNPIGGLSYNWYNASTGGTLLYTGPTYTVANPTANVTVYVGSSASSGTCTSATRTEGIVTVNSVPSAPSLVTSGATVCSGGNTTLQVSNPVSGYTYNWYTSASGGSSIYTGDVYNLSDVTASATYFVSSDDNGCSSANRTPVTVDLSAAASEPTVTAGSTAVCPGDDDVLTATSTTSGAIFTWYTTSMGGTAVATGSTFTTGPLTSDTTFYVQASTAAGCTDSSARASIALGTLQALSAPTVTIQTRTPTSVTFQWAPVPGAEAYQVSLDSGLTWVTPSSGPTGTTETINGLLPNQQTSIEVKAIGQSPCQTSVASAKASGYSENPLGDNIFVPNIFSPNGDGVNDILYVYSNAIASLVFRVYNQWGQEVFESRNQSTGWDGTMSGVKQPVGVYIYVLSATMQDGTIVNKKGSVTLIR
jgi:gliding motility-associated-like protein